MTPRVTEEQTAPAMLAANVVFIRDQADGDFRDFDTRTMAWGDPGRDRRGAWSAGVGAVAAAYRHDRLGSEARNPAVTALLPVAIVGVGGGVLVLLAIAWAHPSLANAAGMYAGYAGGAAVIVGMCAAVVAGVLAAMRRVSRTPPD